MHISDKLMSNGSYVHVADVDKMCMYVRSSWIIRVHKTCAVDVRCASILICVKGNKIYLFFFLFFFVWLATYSLVDILPLLVEHKIEQAKSKPFTCVVCSDTKFVQRTHYTHVRQYIVVEYISIYFNYIPYMYIYIYGIL